MSNTKLKKIAQELSQKILSNQHNNFSKQPFQHLFINDAFNRAIAEDALKSFPVADAKGWDFSNDDVEIKYRSKWTSEFDIPDGLIEIIRVFNSSIISRQAKGSMKFAVPIATAEAPAYKNSKTSSAFIMPPIPMIGKFTS